MSDEAEYPSIRLAFDQVKGVLPYQRHTAETIDGKASTLFATGTAVLGIGLPLGISRLDSTFTWVLILGLLPVFAYGVAVAFMYIAYKPRKWITLDNPVDINKNFLRLQPDEFVHEILMHTEGSFEKNDVNLKAKATALERLLIAVAFETSPSRASRSMFGVFATGCP